MIEAQLLTGYESGSDFREAFSRLLGIAPIKSGQINALKALKALKASWLDTPFGPMIAIADEEKLYLLEFIDRKGLEPEIERLKRNTKSVIVPGVAPPIHSIKNELFQYFEGQLQLFATPACLIGTPFQKRVWEELKRIPFGETLSYSQLAALIGKPSAFRAVARANASNQFAIMIPCHRVINLNGELGGYAGGVARKKRLIDHEKKLIA